MWSKGRQGGGREGSAHCAGRQVTAGSSESSTKYFHWSLSSSHLPIKMSGVKGNLLKINCLRWKYLEKIWWYGRLRGSGRISGKLIVLSDGRRLASKNLSEFQPNLLGLLTWVGKLLEQTVRNADSTRGILSMGGEWIVDTQLTSYGVLKDLGVLPLCSLLWKITRGSLACWESQVYKHLGATQPNCKTEITRSRNVYLKVGQGGVVNESLGIYFNKKGTRSRMTQFGGISGAKLKEIKSQTLADKNSKTSELWF